MKDSLDFVLSPAKKKGLSLSQGEKFFTSRIDPIEEGLRLYRDQITSQEKVPIFIGCVPIYHIVEALKHFPFCVLLEPNPRLALQIQSLLLAIISNDSAFDGAWLNRLAVFSIDQLPNYFQQLDQKKLKPAELQLIEGRNDLTDELTQKNYRQIQSHILAWTKSHNASHLTENYFSFLWRKNTVKNLLSQSPLTLLSDLRVSEAVNTAILVASGPSLEAQLKNLKQLSSHFPIFALPGTAKLLHDHGVEPTAWISTDGGYWNQCHFESLFPPTETKILSIFPFSIQPLIPRKLKRVAFFFDDVSLRECIHLDSKTFELNLIPQSGTVTNSALAILKQLGFKNILTSGVDFEITPWKIHALGATSEELFFSQVTRLSPYDQKQKDLVPLKLIKKDNTYSEPRYEIYSELFRQAVRQTGLEVFRVGDSSTRFELNEPIVPNLLKVAPQNHFTIFQLIKNKKSLFDYLNEKKPKDSRKTMALQQLKKIESQLLSADKLTAEP